MKYLIPCFFSLSLVAGCGDSTPSGTADSGTPDTGASDTGVKDVVATDNGFADAGLPDNGVADTGVADTGVADTGVRDAGTMTDVAAPRDVAASDGGADAGDAAAAPFACLGRVTPTTATATTGMIRAQMQNFQTRAPIAGLTVKACARADAACATPHSMGTTDSMGIVTLTFPMSGAGFDGYFETTGGTGADAVVPTRSFVFPSIHEASVMVSFALVPQATFTLLGSALGATLDDTHGGIVFGASDCNGDNAPGVSVATTPALPAESRFYFAGGLPNPSATQTDASGRGGFLNVPPGAYTVTGTVVSSATRLGAVDVTVRGRYLSAFNVVPTP